MLSPLICSPFITHNCCLQIVNLHELAIGPAKRIRSIVEYPVRFGGRTSALAVIAHHRHPIPLRKRSNVMVPTKTAPGPSKGIWVSGDNRGHMERAEIARHMDRIMDDVFHVAEKPSRDLVWGNQKAYIQKKATVGPFSSFLLFLCWKSDEHIETVRMCSSTSGAFSLLRLFVAEVIAIMILVVCYRYRLVTWRPGTQLWRRNNLFWKLRFFFFKGETKWKNKAC